MDRALETIRREDLKKIAIAALLLFPAAALAGDLFTDLNEKIITFRSLISPSMQQAGVYRDTMYSFNGGVASGSLMIIGILDYYNRLIAILAPGLAVIVWLQYRDTKALRAGEFLEFLPVKRRRAERIRFLHGMACYTIPLLVFAVAALFIRSRFYEDIMQINAVTSMLDQIRSDESLRKLCACLAFGFINMLSFHLMLVWLQKIMRSSGFAALVGVIVQSVPWYLVYSMNYFSIHTYGNGLAKYQELEQLFRPLTGIEHNSYSVIGDPVTSVGVYMADSFSLMGWRTLLFAAAGVIFMTAIVRLERKRDLARDTQDFYYPAAEKIFQIGVAVCTAFFIPRMPLIDGLERWIVVSFMVLTAVILYLLLVRAKMSGWAGKLRMALTQKGGTEYE